MAVKISGLLTPNSGNYVAEAKNIAITLGEETKTLQTEIEDLIDSIPTTEQTGADIKYDSSADSETIKKKIDDINTALSSLGTSADKISYTKSGETEATTVKAILDELLSKEFVESIDADKVIYTPATEDSEAVTIKEEVDSKQDLITNAASLPLDISKTLNEGTVGKYLKDLNTENIAQNVTTAQTAANTAKAANTNLTYGYYIDSSGNVVATYCTDNQKYTSDGTSTGTTVTDGKLGDISVTFVKGVQTVAQEYVDKFDEVLNIADTLSSNFEADSQFKVVTNSTYKNMYKNNTLDPATIYFCYDGTADKEDLLYDVLLTGTSTNGTVKISCGSESIQTATVENKELTSLAYNSTLKFTIIPNSGYRVSSFKINGSNISTSTTSYKVTEDLKILVYFEVIPTYTITYMLDDLEYITQTYKEGDTIVLPDNPTKEGYTFSNWDPELGTTMGSANITTTAIFTADDNA